MESSYVSIAWFDVSTGIISKWDYSCWKFLWNDMIWTKLPDGFLQKIPSSMLSLKKDGAARIGRFVADVPLIDESFICLTLNLLFVRLG